MFDFLSNIYNTAKTGVSSAVNYVSNLASPAATMQFPVGRGLDPIQKAVAQANVSGQQLPQQSIQPNMSTIFGPAQGGINTSTINYQTAQGVANIPKSSIPVLSSPYYSGNPSLLPPSLSVKPSTTVAASKLPVAQSSPMAPVIRQASTPIQSGGYNTDWFTPSGIPRSGKNGVPIYGEQGISGQSGAGVGSQTGPATTGGSGGAGGFSVGGNPLGTFNASSLGFNGDATDENSLFKQLKYNPASGRAEAIPGSPMSQQPGVITYGQSPTMGSRLVAQPNEKPLTAPNIPNTLNAAELAKSASLSHSVTSLSSHPNDLQTVANNAKQAIDSGVADILQKKGITPEKTLVEDTPEFNNFISNLSGEDKFSYQQFADNFRTQNGMSDWLKLKESSLAAVQTATSFYNDLIKEIKLNPDMPKAVAGKRIQMFVEQRDSILEKAKADMTMASNAIGDINTSLHSQLGIVQADKSEADKKRQINFDVFKALLESGTAFSNAEKSQWATALGISPGALNSLVAKTAKKDVQIITDAQGTIAVDKTTGKTIWTTARGAEKVSGTADQKARENDYIANSILDFKDKMTKNGWAGANPDYYNYYASQLKKNYGASAVLSLDKAMNEAGISVDNTNK